MTTRKRRWPRLPGPLQSTIESLALSYETWSPKQIFDYLERQSLERPDEYPQGIPDIRTVQRIVSRCRPPDPSGPWIPTEWPGEDAKLVLEVLTDRYLWWKRNEPFPKITVREAELILWVRKVAPTLGKLICLTVARMYIARQAAGESTDAIDRSLTICPSNSDYEAELYEAEGIDGEIATTWKTIIGAATPPFPRIRTRSKAVYPTPEEK